MNKLTKPFNHPKLGGDVVNLRKDIPAPKKKPELSGEELLYKATIGRKIKK